jgi:4-hydroxyphenylpyruvate dioxygenase
MIQIDHVHFYVEDAHIWRDWFVKYLGFQRVVNSLFPSYENQGSSLHTLTEVVKNGDVYFLLSSPLLPCSPVAEYLHFHPPGVVDVAFVVDDLKTVTAKATVNGATLLQPIENCEFYKYAKISGWGKLSHSLIERNIEKTIIEQDGFIGIDHVVLNVEAGDLPTAVKWYQNILDFQPQQSFNIQTDFSGLHSQVMISANGKVQLPINEPASANSQIQEFLEFNRGSGVQHIALHTRNLIDAIARFRAAGLSFLSVPKSYYLQLQQRLNLPLSPEELQAIAQQEILVDSQKDAPLEALLLQIFTQPIFTEPTFFLEFIERRSHASGFGEGNFHALFTAMESEQIKRGFVSRRGDR